MKDGILGPWSEVKLAILRDYESAYSRILAKQPFQHIYIDAFAGRGTYLSRTTNSMVPGSPLNALRVSPPFFHYYFIDLDGENAARLREVIGERTDVTIFQGDSNEILLKEVFPMAKYEDYKRALCFLDPFGLHLSWDVVRTAGHMRSVEILLNFPVYDMNLNALWRKKPTGQDPRQTNRMDRFWGDSSWRDAAYESESDLFGHTRKVSDATAAIVKAYRKRLKEVAGYKFVPQPIPMRNTTGNILYYLFFATHNETGNKIVSSVFKKYRT